MIGMVLFNILIPMFNPKHKGQSLGKMIFKITPIFEDGDNANWSIVKRELPISLFQVLILTMILSTGYNLQFMAMQYKQWYESIINANAAVLPEIIEQFKTAVPHYTNIWHFITVIAPNAQYVASNAISIGQVITGYTKEILEIAWPLLLIVIMISIAFGENKRGLHDRFSKTSIIDLKTLQTEENYKKLVEKKVEIKPTKVENSIPIKLNINAKAE